MRCPAPSARRLIPLIAVQPRFSTVRCKVLSSSPLPCYHFASSMVVRSRSKDSQLPILLATRDSAVLRTPPPPPFSEEYQNKGLNPQGSAKNIILKHLIRADSWLARHGTPPTDHAAAPSRVEKVTAERSSDIHSAANANYVCPPHPDVTAGTRNRNDGHLQRFSIRPIRDTQKESRPRNAASCQSWKRLA